MTTNQKIITFLLQCQTYPETIVNKKFHNKVKGKAGYIDDQIHGFKTKVGISAHGDLRLKVPYLALL